VNVICAAFSIKTSFSWTNTFEIHSISTSKSLIHLIIDDIKNYYIFGTIVPLLNVKPNWKKVNCTNHGNEVYVGILFFCQLNNMCSLIFFSHIYQGQGHVWYHFGLPILRTPVSCMLHMLNVKPNWEKVIYLSFILAYPRF
jgi:hypothetical protein